MSLVQKYRPQHFEDIVGQSEAVKLLSQAALRGGALENVLLYGPRGLGKTSLVPIYAMAVNCCSPSPMGSPCRSQACKGCDSFQDHYRYYSIPKNPGLEAVQYWVEAQINSTWSGIKRTLFFDEAHMLSDGAMAYLLQVMEDRRPNISFCFATTELGRLTTAFISRCLKIQLEPLSLEESLVLLRRTAESERYLVEHDALVLLARYKRGYARDLIQGLNQVALYGDKVDVENVRAVFDLDQDKDVVDYLLAAIKSDEHLLVSIKQRWRSSAADKIVLIRALLTSLYYRNVCNLDIAISPAVDVIADGRQELVSAMMTRAGATKTTEVRSFAQYMTAFWVNVTIDVDEGALECQLASFEEALRLFDGSPRPLAVERTPEIEARPIQASCEPIHDTSEPLQRYVSFGDIEKIVNRSSFFVQHYGKTFNAACIVTPLSEHAKFEPASHDAFGQFLEDFAAAFEAPPAAFIALPERDELEIVLRVVAHVPCDNAEMVRRALQHVGTKKTYDIFDMSVEIGNLRKLHKTHWRLIRELCSGFADPDGVLSYDLLSKLGVRGKRRTPGPLRRPRPIFSRLLSNSLIEDACAMKMGYLSAFNVRQWGCIGGEWELEEFNERRGEIASRRRYLIDLKACNGGDNANWPNVLAQAEQGWLDAEDRPRKWTKGRWF